MSFATPKEKLKVYMGSCGVGLGHVTRCETIASQLTKRGCDVVFSTYLDGLSYLNRTNWKHISSPPISFKTREDGTIDTKLTATKNGVTVGLWKFAKQLISEVREIIQFNPDAVISDTRLSTLLAGFLLRRPRLLVINQYSVQMPRHPDRTHLIDRIMLAYARLAWTYASAMLDLVWGLSNIIVIPDFATPLTVSTYNLSIPRRVARRVRFVGPLSATKNNVLHSTAKTGGGRPNIFVCISGPATDRQHLVTVLFDILKPLAGNASIIMSCGDPKGLDSPVTREGVTVYEWMKRDDYEDAVRSADIIISRAGHSTIMLGITEGKPLILIPPPNHTEQANNARRAEELGVATVLDQSSLDSNSLAAAVKDILAEKQEWPVLLRAAVRAEDGVTALERIVYSLGRKVPQSSIRVETQPPQKLIAQ